MGTVVNDHKVAKHFELTITEDSFSYLRRTDSFEREARLDGIYIIRTSQHAAAMSAADTVLAYKDLVRVERALRTLKSVDRQICPLNHWIKLRVRAHVFLCMMGYYGQ